MLRVGEEQLEHDRAYGYLTAYAEDYGSTIEHYDLAGSAASEVAPSTGPISLSDLGRMVFISARLSGDDAAALISHTIDWSGIEPEARLEDADPDASDGLYAAMSRVWAQCTAISGIKRAKASKLLHLKRPFAFPILDRDVRGTYKNRISGSGGVWRPVREDLIAGREALEGLRRDLATSDEQLHRNAARLPTIRLLDILAWKLQHPGQRLHARRASDES
ncbi:MAG: hypothetical protein JWL73_245 [Actinomycetia bacterium]|nr:hypothetical protein [Actinomycetes bacterium]